MLNDSDWSGNYSWFGTHVMLSKQVVLGVASLRKPVSPMGLLFLGDCEHVYVLSPMKALWHLTTCQVMYLLFPHLGCLQGFSPLPSF